MLDDEGPGQERAHRHAEHRAHRPQRRGPRMPPQHVGLGHAARRRGGEIGLAGHFAQRLRLQPLEHGGHRQRQRQRGQQQVPAEVHQPGAPRHRRRRRGRHAADGKPSRPRGDQHQQQRGHERRHRHEQQRQRPDALAPALTHAARPRAARHHAKAHACQRRDQQRGHGEHRRVQCRARHQATHRLVVEIGAAEVRPQDAAGPQRPLCADRAIEIELRAHRAHFIGPGQRTQFRGDVARRQAREHQRRRRGHHDEQEREGGASEEEPGHSG